MNFLILTKTKMCNKVFEHNDEEVFCVLKSLASVS